MDSLQKRVHKHHQWTIYVPLKANESIMVPGAKFFLLRFDAKGDPRSRYARIAMRAYADSIKKRNPKLAADVLTRIEREEGKAHGL